MNMADLKISSEWGKNRSAKEGIENRLTIFCTYYHLCNYSKRRSIRWEQIL